MRAPLNRAGFTLLEALIALTLGAVIVGLVTSVMVAQGRFYRDTSRRAELQGTVRTITDQLREELQAVTRSGITVATGTQLTFRLPISLGVLCAGGVKVKGKWAVDASAYLPSPGGGISSDRVSGYAIRNPSTGAWSYTNTAWGTLSPGTAGAAAACAAIGADTAGGGGDFRQLSASVVGAPDAGTVLMLYTTVEFRFQDSTLRPGARALFRSEAGGTLIEYATGLANTARFEYRRTGQTAFQASVTGGQLQQIEEIRVVSRIEQAGEAEAETILYEWDLRVPLRNLP